jgi:hypothetical protein
MFKYSFNLKRASNTKNILAVKYYLINTQISYNLQLSGTEEGQGSRGFQVLAN